jgi:hypothetical protein
MRAPRSSSLKKEKGVDNDYDDESATDTLHASDASDDDAEGDLDVPIRVVLQCSF